MEVFKGFYIFLFSIPRPLPLLWLFIERIKKKFITPLFFWSCVLRKFSEVNNNVLGGVVSFLEYYFSYRKLYIILIYYSRLSFVTNSIFFYLLFLVVIVHLQFVYFISFCFLVCCHSITSWEILFYLHMILLFGFNSITDGCHVNQTIILLVLIILFRSSVLNHYTFINTLHCCWLQHHSSRTLKCNNTIAIIPDLDK